MKNVFFILIFLMGANFLNAQDFKKRSERSEKRGHHSEMRANKLTEELDLSEEQKAQLTAFQEERKLKMTDLQNEKREQMVQIQSEFHQKLEGILNDDQKVKLEAHKEERKSKMAERKSKSKSDYKGKHHKGGHKNKGDKSTDNK